MPQKPKVSVMQITNRYGNIDILWADMKRQSFTDWELVLVDGLWREREKEVKEYINDKRLNYVRQSDKNPQALTNLAHADNDGFRNCHGELIVCLQDYIWCGPEALSTFWGHYTRLGDCLITGVGHQYSNPSKEHIVNPNGKITVFKEPYTRRPDNRVWNDPRMRLDQGSFYETAPVNWELNFCSISRKIIYELGGMDINYDYYGFAWDNVNIAQRAEMLGYKTYIDQTNECMGFQHDE